MVFGGAIALLLSIFLAERWLLYPNCPSCDIDLSRDYQISRDQDRKDQKTPSDHKPQNVFRGGFVSAWQPKMCKVRNPYSLQYEKDLPWGEDIKRQVELDDITDGRPTVLALHTAHCLYCTTQVHVYKTLSEHSRKNCGQSINLTDWLSIWVTWQGISKSMELTSA
eukprot:sb/3472504/